MRQPEILAVRILPMSDKIKGFRGLTVEEVQSRCFLQNLPANGGKFHYQSTGLRASTGTVVLFQFQAHIIASARFLRDEKFERPTRGYGGVLHFDAASIRTFTPLDLLALRKIWPSLRAFGHVKQFLNPALYPAFRKRLKNVQSPSPEP